MFKQNRVLSPQKVLNTTRADIYENILSEVILSENILSGGKRIYGGEKKSTTDHDSLRIHLKSFFIQSSSGELHWTTVRRDDKTRL